MRIALLILSGMMLSYCTTATSQPGHPLVNDLWVAETDQARRAIGNQLIDAAPDTETLYRWLKQGPAYPAAETGVIELRRIAPDDTVYPYMVVVPEHYDPARPWPVEFMLHGGVGREGWEPGGGWWRGGFDEFLEMDQITVIPASWMEHFWWQDNQAENLPAILYTLKQQYNIDDNRVYLTGISDGGTGTYFYAFKQPEHWASYQPYIGNPGVLTNPDAGGGHRLYFENLLGAAFYIVNGENDRLYPAAQLEPFIRQLSSAGVNHVWRVIENGGHNTRWLPAEMPAIAQFKTENARDPFPEKITWVTDTTERYNKNRWLRIDQLEREDIPGLVDIERSGNHFEVRTSRVSAFTILHNPEEIEFSEPVTVSLNGEPYFEEALEQRGDVMMYSLLEGFDRELMVSAFINVTVE